MNKHSYSEAVYQQPRSNSSQSMKGTFQPKWLNDNNQQSKLNSTIDNSINRLPLNFFHSTSEYNKMLITYGRKRRQNPSAITDGLIKSLQYINDPIFQKQLQKKSRFKQSIQLTKTAKKTIDQCICCCCNQFCIDCARQNKVTRHKNSLSQSDLVKQRLKIHQQIKAIQNRSKRSKKQSLKQSKKSNRKSIKVQRPRSEIKNNYSSIGYSNLNAQALSGSYISKKSVNINNLLKKSLNDFQQKKRIEKLKQLSEMNNRKAKEQYLNNLNEYIRRQNQENLKHQGSQKKQKSVPKAELGLKYWDIIKQKVFQQLKNDKASAPLKHELQNYQYNVYQTIDIPRKKCSLSKEKIIQLRVKHQNQTKEKLKSQANLKTVKQKKVINNLKRLQNQRQTIISKCKQAPFNPTAEMITKAFKNIIDPPLVDGGKNQQKLKKSFRGKQKQHKK